MTNPKKPSSCQAVIYRLWTCRFADGCLASLDNLLCSGFKLVGGCAPKTPATQSAPLFHSVWTTKCILIYICQLHKIEFNQTPQQVFLIKVLLACGGDLPVLRIAPLRFAFFAQNTWDLPVLTFIAYVNPSIYFTFIILLYYHLNYLHYTICMYHSIEEAENKSRFTEK